MFENCKVVKVERRREKSHYQELVIHQPNKKQSVTQIFLRVTYFPKDFLIPTVKYSRTSASPPKCYKEPLNLGS